MAATLQRKSFSGIIFVIITKKITKIIVSGNYFVIISGRMVTSNSSDGVRVRFRERFQAAKVPIFSGFPVETPTKKATTSKLF